ncbi:transcriptional regulator, partial [Striga asiatica]
FTELERVEHLKVPPDFPPIELRHVFPKTVHSGQPRLPVHDDLRGPAVHGGEGREPARHGLDHREPERLVKRRLDKSAPGVGYAAVELSVAQPVHLGRDPPELTVQVVGLDQVVHFLHLGSFLEVFRLLAAVTADHDEVDEVAEAGAVGVELDEAGEVLDAVETGHAANRDCVPLRGVRLALLEEIDQYTRDLLPIVRVDVKARLPVHDNLGGPAVHGGEIREPARHGSKEAENKHLP